MPDAVPPHYIRQTWPGDTGCGRLAYRHTPSKTSEQNTPSVLFCAGFHSNMDGRKASCLHRRCAKAGIGFTRFDYRGHGLSDGAFAAGTIGDWAADARLILDAVCGGPQIVVGSSMGAWMALMLARDRPARIAGLVLIAPGLDFPRRLMLPGLSVEARATLARDGVWHRPSEFEEPPYPVTRRLIEESTGHELLNGPPVAVSGPVRILHGTADEVVSLSHAEAVRDWLGGDVVLEAVAGGDHRLSDPAGLKRLWRTVAALVAGG